MSLVTSLLRAIIDVDGEALVVHAGEKPYVVAPAGRVDLANPVLTPEAVERIVAQLLPAGAAHALEEFGAVQHEMVSSPDFPGDSFTIVAARTGGDMWVEIRRKKAEHGDFVPTDSLEPAALRLAIAATVQRVTEAVNLRRPPAIPAPAPSATMPPGADAPPSPPLPPLASVAPPPAVVLPLSRSPIRSESAPAAASGVSGLDRLLRMASARGASTLYLSSNAQPSIRVDGEVRMLDGEAILGPADVESLLLTVIPDRQNESLRSGTATEWISDIDGVGRVRCLSFRDQRGPGGVFRLMPVRAVSTDQLGLPREVEALALETGGLVLIVGPRLSGKRTMMAAFVDHMNRTRHDHLITIESEINVIHKPGTAIISQREVRGGNDDLVGAARAALREDPDVLVIESMRTRSLVDVALEAAATGQLVVGGLPAHDAASAVDRIINLYAAEHRREVQLALAQNLRGIVAQVLLRRNGTGRVAAREVLLNTPAVASVIAEGKTSQLPAAIDGGRRHGMQRLNDALAGLVQAGVVDVREAYRHAADRAGLVALLKRLDIDTAPIERRG